MTTSLRSEDMLRLRWAREHSVQATAWGREYGCDLQPHAYNSVGQTAEGQGINRTFKSTNKEGLKWRGEDWEGTTGEKRGHPGTCGINRIPRKRACPLEGLDISIKARRNTRPVRKGTVDGQETFREVDQPQVSFHGLHGSKHAFCSLPWSA